MGSLTSPPRALELSEKDNQCPFAPRSLHTKTSNDELAPIDELGVGYYVLRRVNVLQALHDVRLLCPDSGVLEG